MKKSFIFMFFIFIGIISVNAETWRELRNRVQVMTERVIVPKYFSSDAIDGLDNLAAVIATHDWCMQTYKAILNNDNTMGDGERAGMLLSQTLHEVQFKRYWDYGTKLSGKYWDYLNRRYDYWFEHLKNGGWITFQDMRE